MIAARDHLPVRGLLAEPGIKCIHRLHGTTKERPVSTVQQNFGRRNFEFRLQFVRVRNCADWWLLGGLSFYSAVPLGSILGFSVSDRLPLHVEGSVGSSALKWIVVDRVARATAARLACWRARVQPLELILAGGAAMVPTVLTRPGAL